MHWYLWGVLVFGGLFTAIAIAAKPSDSVWAFWSVVIAAILWPLAVVRAFAEKLGGFY
ncbi:MAG: hypothetical protein AAGB19_19540 [Cyanobacteria bacterium P01_F01_bin.3]